MGKGWSYSACLYTTGSLPPSHTPRTSLRLDEPSHGECLVTLEYPMYFLRYGAIGPHLPQ